VRALAGNRTQRTHGLAESLEQLENESPAFREQVVAFLDGRVSHYVFDEGKLVVAHAGMKADLAGRTSGAVRSFALYGETTGEIDTFGLPVRHDWAAEYRGKALTVYGHTPVPEIEWLNNTVNIDTGCVFGGSLTALRYPEQDVVSVDASRVYCEPVKPFLDEETDDDRSAQQINDAMLDIDDVRGKQIVETRFSHPITIREERAVAALQVMSRYSVDPRWLIYLPPTMAPGQASDAPDFLEHPDEVYTYFQVNGVDQVVCEEKHMGSRATLIVCRDAEAASRRFGVEEGSAGVCFTRTGRRFFEDDDLETAFLSRVREAVGSAGLWTELETDWVLLDCELMPWSARAQQLLKDQYAAVGAAATMSVGATVDALETALARGIDVSKWLGDYRDRKKRIDQYINAYRAYCWPVASLADLKLAPFHLLATEGHVHHDKPHSWHLNMIERLCGADHSLLISTANRSVDLRDEADRRSATDWWLSLTEKGGEGMVVKPLDFIT
jgi:protein phosphatase